MYRLRLVKLGDALFLDVEPKRIMNLSRVDEYDPLLIPGHFILACSFKDDSMLLRPLQRGRAEKAAKAKNVNLPLLDSGGNIVLTMTTRDLQKFIADNKDAFSEDPVVLSKKQESKR